MAAVAGNQAALLCVMGEAGRAQILWGLRVEANCWRLKSRGLRFGKMNLGQNCPEGARADQGDCTFPARDGGLSGNGEKQVPLRMLRN